VRKKRERERASEIDREREREKERESEGEAFETQALPRVWISQCFCKSNSYRHMVTL